MPDETGAPCEPRLERAIELASLQDPQDDRAYWMSRPPLERLAHVERLRRINYGHDYDAEGLQRVLEHASIERS